ncbi:hypothetical protein AB1I63_01110 [Streptococcus pneumoniae]
MKRKNSYFKNLCFVIFILTPVLVACAPDTTKEETASFTSSESSQTKPVKIPWRMRGTWYPTDVQADGNRLEIAKNGQVTVGKRTFMITSFERLSDHVYRYTLSNKGMILNGESLSQQEKTYELGIYLSSDWSYITPFMAPKLTWDKIEEVVAQFNEGPSSNSYLRSNPSESKKSSDEEDFSSSVSTTILPKRDEFEESSTVDEVEDSIPSSREITSPKVSTPAWQVNPGPYTYEDYESDYATLYPDLYRRHGFDEDVARTFMEDEYGLRDEEIDKILE